MTTSAADQPTRSSHESGAVTEQLSPAPTPDDEVENVDSATQATAVETTRKDSEPPALDRPRSSPTPPD